MSGPASNAWSVPEAWTCDEMLRDEILARLEAEFGPMTYPEPRESVWHQRLTSDADWQGHR